jgi:hypothetical protein
MIKRISHSRLLQLVHYDPETGEMKWLKPTSFRVKVGQTAGSFSGNGYKQVKIDGTVYNFHRIVWFYMTGVWPDRWIDHSDGDFTNNRFENLRLSSVSQNAGNMKMRSDNSTGLKGVERKRSKFAARIRHEGVRHNLGVFDTAEEAHAAYFSAAQRLFGEFARAA